ncbi:MAG TPA: transglycosylase domain-containing protein [Acidobacteriaceae bacterium]|jgi:penicillin-binding protein 1B|nr:transglycosylase domain-containing protein [Acidobacteriaceae bacterium]
MPVKVKLDRSQQQQHSLLFKLLRIALLLVLIVAIIGGSVFAYFYHEYEGLVSARLAHGPLLASVAQIYAAPEEVRPDQQLTAENIAASLRRAGYNSNPQMGTYRLEGETVQVKPGPESYLAADGATIVSSNGQIQTITAENGAALAAYKLEPELITALSEDKGRTKRLMVTYNQIPPRMVQAVLAIEDRRFFEHGGINYGRTMECVVQDLVARRRECGGSTLTQQLARGFFLTPQKTISRKIAEAMIALQLESRFTKQQIFEMYANEVNIGQRGSFAIQGIGEASQAYFGKDLRQLDLAQTALIAGIINSPNWLNPYRHPSRAMTRRNLVLDAMVETGAISASEAERAKAEPLKLAPPNVDASEAPYFIDLVHDQIVQRLGDSDLAHSGSLRIYTSLDPQLQAAASEAVDAGMKHVDELIRKFHRKGSGEIAYPQVALIALDPHTGQVLALVGGRNYGVSQLDHALAERPTGSIFKPFVYAAAYNTSLDGTDLDGSSVFTALTRLNDDPTTFMFDGKPYTPGNFVRGEYPGMITAVEAIEHSLNIATINLAQMVGFDNVAALARSAGIVNARGTPSVAIGTYNATPLDMAGAYTVFANGGVHLKPWLLASVRNPNGDILADFAPEAKQILDPRVAYLTQSLLENVMTYGTGSAARKYGFTAPAAGKTGTSHDVWFAGYSSNLLCIIWVGNDDYTDISHDLTHPLQGADAAAPIWAEFMNRAIKLPQYSDMKPLGPAPDGVQILRIDRATDLTADDTCPSDSFNVAFLVGTAPQGTCSQMGEDSQTLANKLFNSGADNQDDQTKHRNFLQKMFGLGKNKDQQQQPQPQQQPLPQ